MDELKGKGVYLVLAVIAAFVFYSMRGGGGGAVAPAQYAVHQGIDTEYEQLKIGAEVAKAGIAGEVFRDLLDADTAKAKFASDERIAEIEGSYGYRIAAAGFEASRHIASTYQMGENYRTGVNASAARNMAREQASAQRHASWAGAIGDAARGFFGLFS